MGVRWPSVVSTTFIGPLPANANETAVLTSPPLNIPVDSAQIIILWFANVTSGTGTNSFGYALRRGSGTAGPLLDSFGYFAAVTAGNTLAMSGVAVDTPGAVAEQQYTLTIQQAGASGAGTWRAGYLLAFAL